MSRFSAFFVSALFLFPAAFGNEVAQFAPPMTQMILHDKLYTTIHTNVQHARNAYFSGKVVGKYEKVGGMGSYTGNFQGNSDGQKTHATFKYNVDGSCKSMGFNVKYDGSVNGKLNVIGKRISVNARYTSNISGTAHGKKISGDCNGNAYFSMRHGKFFYSEKGSIKIIIGGKSVTAKYYATLNKDAVKVSVYGMYAGKKFFLKYSFSLNLLPLGLDANPMMIKRNYGTVYVTVGGKKFTRKYDVKGMELPTLN